jgi:hypothetical protein
MFHGSAAAALNLAEAEVDTLPLLATAHLLLKLRPINRALRLAVERQHAASVQGERPDLAPLCVTPEHVQLLLNQVEALHGLDVPERHVPLPSDVESVALQAIEQRAAAIDFTLPLDELAHSQHLTPFEVEALLLCAAPELDRGYERIYAYLLDDLNRRYPCVELLSTLTAASVQEQIQRRHLLSSTGRLRRLRLLLPIGEAPTGLRQELRLAPDVFEMLTGSGVDPACLCADEGAVALDASPTPPDQLPSGEFEHLCESLATGRVSAVGIWGARYRGAEEVIQSLAARLGRPLRRVLVPAPDVPSMEAVGSFTDQLRFASAQDACLWLQTDAVLEPGRERIEQALCAVLARATVPVLLTGETPWRPRELIRGGGYTELELGETPMRVREELWSRNLPELSGERIEGIAARYNLSSTDVRSATILARTRARVAGNGKPDPVERHIDAACALVTRRSTEHFATAVRPRRGPDDLVLLENLHQQILEVARFYRLRNRVDEEWGFGHLASGCGMKVLFTGDPGTGKTLSAEVIAGLLGLTLYTVDLSRIVSKWIGETEKNLEAVFREAEDSHAVLFFDEADSLFGKRGEIQRGSDRYANLEVSYLLQRLESCRGLVILASNVKDQIDAAFLRRFQVVVHFPRPGLAERRRIWHRAFPASAPIDPNVDLEVLARLDLTGASIVACARTSALLAADAHDATIGMAHVVRATARQFRREARVLTPSELGSYGALLQGAS